MAIDSPYVQTLKFYDRPRRVQEPLQPWPSVFTGVQGCRLTCFKTLKSVVGEQKPYRSAKRSGRHSDGEKLSFDTLLLQRFVIKILCGLETVT